MPGNGCQDARAGSCPSHILSVPWLCKCRKLPAWPGQMLQEEPAALTVDCCERLGSMAVLLRSSIGNPTPRCPESSQWHSWLTPPAGAHARGSTQDPQGRPLACRRRWAQSPKEGVCPNCPPPGPEPGHLEGPAPPPPLRPVNVLFQQSEMRAPWESKGLIKRTGRGCNGFPIAQQLAAQLT